MEKILNYHITFLDSYLDSILCLPIILTLYLAEKRILTNKPLLIFSFFELIVISIALAIFFEEVLPLISNKFTKDYFDYIALAFGLILFWFFGNKSLSKTI